MTYYSIYSSPLGPLTLEANDKALIGLSFGTFQPESGTEKKTEILEEAEKQLTEYFSGRRFKFDLPLAPEGTDFQKKVWSELRNIPYGKCITYGEQARRIGRPRAVRAVGGANGRNPIGIIIPCHRVIGSNGLLTGFSGGLDIKKKLLALEGLPISR